MENALDRPQLADGALAVVEVLAVLAAAFALTLLFTMPFVPLTNEVSLLLVPERAGTGAGDDELVEAFGELEIASGVRVERDGAARLVLTGVTFTEPVRETTLTRLEALGYRRVEPRFARTIDMQKLFGGTARLTMTVQAGLFVLAGWLFARLRIRRGDAPRATAPLGPLVWGLIGGVGAFSVSLVIGAVMSLVGLPVEEQAILRSLMEDRASLLRLTPWIVLLVPFSEEVFFRGYVFRFLSQRAGFGAGLWISSLLFALIHFNPSGLFVYLGIGVVMVLVYVRSSSLIAPVLAHMLHNSTVLVVSLVAGPPGP